MTKKEREAENLSKRIFKSIEKTNLLLKKLSELDEQAYIETLELIRENEGN